MFQQESKYSLVDYVAKANGVTLNPDDISLSEPKVVAGTWREGTTERNTAIRLLGSETNVYEGRVVVTYDRLNLASLGEIPGFQIRADGAVSVYDLLDSIKFYNALILTENDVEDTAIVDNGDGTFSAVISAKPTSVGWYGSVSVPVLAGGVAIDDQIAVADLPGLNYPTVSDQDTYAQVYLYGYDFTTSFDDLIDLEPGTLPSLSADALVTALQAIDVSSGKDLWNNSDVSTEWSLNGAEIVHNGLNDSGNMPTNPAYKYVLAINLRAGVTIPTGTLYLHYNDPFDPNDF